MCLSLPLRVVALDGDLAEVVVNGVARQVQLSTLDEPVAVGDWLLVHSGFALRRMRAEEAHQLQAMLDAWSAPESA